MIKQLVYPWHWVLVFNGDGIQLAIVNAKPKRPILLFGEKRRRHPWRSIMTDEAQSPQLLDLFLQFLQFSRSHSIRWRKDRVSAGKQIDGEVDFLHWWHSWKLFRKYIWEFSDHWW